MSLSFSFFALSFWATYASLSLSRLLPSFYLSSCLFAAPVGGCCSLTPSAVLQFIAMKQRITEKKPTENEARRDIETQHRQAKEQLAS